MKSLSESRRNFLKKMLAAGIATAACPHLLLGKTDPEVIIADNKITIKHSINVLDYPVLANNFGSIRLDIKDPDDRTFRIVVTKVPYKQYRAEYAVVGEVCPHQGKVIGDPQPPAGLMRCNLGHGSLFLADGSFVDGPAAGKNLNQYKSTFNADTSVLEIEFDYIISGTDVSNEHISLNYLDEVYPNPSSNTALITYGLEKGGYCRLVLYDYSGREVAVIADGYNQPGIKSISYNVSSLDSGVYFLYMFVGSDKKFGKKLIVQK